MSNAIYENASEFIYKLFFHENIEDPGKKVPELTIIQRTKTTLTKNGESFDINLDELLFERKIYQPGCIVANIQISFQSDKVSESSSSAYIGSSKYTVAHLCLRWSYAVF